MVHLTVGSPVEGKDFYGRNELIKLIWDRLEKNNLLLAAPRRFGKTSIMLNLRDNSRRNWRVFLLDTEWIKDPSEFIAELAAELSKESKAREFFEKIWGKLRDSIDEVALAEFDTENHTYSFASKVLKDWWLIHYRLFDEGV